MGGKGLKQQRNRWLVVMNDLYKEGIMEGHTMVVRRVESNKERWCQSELTILYFLWVPRPTSRNALLYQLVIAKAVDQVIGEHILGVW